MSFDTKVRCLKVKHSSIKKCQNLSCLYKNNLDLSVHLFLYNFELCSHNCIFFFFYNPFLNLCTVWPILVMNQVWELREAAILDLTPSIAADRKI